ncbi:hypothetical protein CRE_02495 [Caenorhabditis remanei]|uniref:Uncharacterized protein n=1 Tax=Caenorhabditis remanei TaxID=31234 RepID=E3MWU2_CAERE|nr:hypothetical protein CRE_02495 [Caenorhabditis remanei]
MQHFELTDILTKLGFLLSFLFNSFFIYLTVFYIKDIFGTYKKLIIFFSIVGILFSGLEVCARPFAHNFNNSLFYFSLNNSGPESLVIFAIMLWAGFYVIIVSSIAVQFIYRYLCLLESEKVRKINILKNLCWMFYPVLPGTFYTGALYMLCWPDEYSDSYVRNVILENYQLDVANLRRFVMTPYNTDESIRWNNFTFHVIAAVLVCFHYSIIIFCGFRMHISMKHELENPLLPPVLGIKINWQTGWLYSFIGVYPPFDSVAFMVIVTEYKVLIRRRFLKFFNKNRESTVYASVARPMNNRSSALD